MLQSDIRDKQNDDQDDDAYDYQWEEPQNVICSVPSSLWLPLDSLMLS